MKKLIGFGLVAVAAAIVLGGCVTYTPNRAFTDFTAQNARNIHTSYDLQIVSNDDTIAKVYKLVQKADGQVFYAISETDWQYDDVNAEDLEDFVVITKQNAEDLVAFIDTVESTYKKQPRKTDGVLYDIAIVRDYTYKEMTVDSITSSNSTTSGTQSTYSSATGAGIVGSQSVYGWGSTSGNAVTRSMKEFEEEDELVRIQLKTVENEDVIIFAVAGFAEMVDLDDLKSLRTALSK